MGFFAMLFSMILGVFLIALGTSRMKNKKSRLWMIVVIAIGIVLVLFAIWLGLPKQNLVLFIVNRKQDKNLGRDYLGCNPNPSQNVLGTRPNVLILNTFCVEALPHLADTVPEHFYIGYGL